MNKDTIKQALEAAKRWHQGSSWRFSDDAQSREAWQSHMDQLDAGIAALSAAPSDAQPQEQPNNAVRVLNDAQIAECAVEVGLPYGPETWEALCKFAHQVALILAAPVTVQPAKPEAEVISNDEILEIGERHYHPVDTSGKLFDEFGFARDIERVVLTRCATSKEASAPANNEARNAAKEVLNNLDEFGPSHAGFGEAIDRLERALQSHPAQASSNASDAAQDEKCTCVYANAQNTPAVRKGLEMSGYVKELCEPCRKRRDAAQAAQPCQQAEPVQAVTLTDAPFKLVNITSPGYEGWANLIYTGPEWQGGPIAMCHPPVADAFRRLLAGSAKGEAD